MDADHASEWCPEHGAPRNCPAMCPVYDLDSDNPVRQRYEALRAEVGDVEAHLIMGDSLPDHDEDEHCAWLDQFAEAAEEQAIIGVHEYQLLKTVQERKGHGPRDVIVDEAPRALRNTRRLKVLELTRAANMCDHLAATPGTPDGFTEIAGVARGVIDAIADGGKEGGLGALDAPYVGGETITITVDPDDPPADVDPDEIEVGHEREVVDPTSGQYVERERHYVECELLGEQLAQLKLEYNETLVKKMKNDEWDGTPLCFDALLAAAVRAGLDADAARQAIAVPTTLDHCPWCGSELALDNGARCCSSDTCDWHEEHNYVTRRDGERARADAYLDLDGDDDEEEALVYEELPLPSELPDRPIVLDATADRDVIAALYGVAPEEMTVYGDEPLDANMRVTQVLDGQYHAGTIKQSEPVRERIQRTINTGGDLYEKPLFLVKGGLRSLFDFPDNAVVRKYHALRGLDFAECDAVFAIGAPHPRIDDLEREARLLAMGRDDLEVGGEEYSTRRGEDGTLAANEPVYRKLNYVDENGKGRAVPTKHYSGLVGARFREGRENELVQGINRARPLLADEDNPVDVYLLTNVPTDLPVDEVCTFDELADPLEAMLPVPEGALELVDAIEGVTTGRDVPDGFRADSLLNIDNDGTAAVNKRAATRLAGVAGITTREGNTPRYETVARWIDALADVGLLAPGDYEQRRGVRFAADTATLTSALSVLSSNDSLKVAAVRRFRAMVEAADGSLEWLRWARDAFDLRGDPCERHSGVDPPPG